VTLICSLRTWGTKSKDTGNIKLCPKNRGKLYRLLKKIYDKEQEKEKFEIRVTDSFRFLQSCLEKLVNNLEKEPFTHLQETFEEDELLRRKGVFPYDWFNSLRKFEDTQLPPKELSH